MPDDLAAAVAYHRAGRLADAERIYRQILTIDPRNGDALHLLGVLAHQARHHGVAVQLLRQAIAVAPDAAEFHKDLGHVLLDTADLAGAEQAYRIAAKLRPGYAEAHALLGSVLQRTARDDAAIVEFERSLSFRPGNAKVLSNLGLSHMRRGRFAAAANCFRAAIGADPSLVEPHVNLCNVFVQLGRLDEAVAAGRAAIALAGDVAEAHNNLANAYREAARIDDAIAEYQAAIRCRDHYAEGHSNLGTLLKDQGRIDQAVQHLRRAVDLSPGDPSLHSNLLYCLEFDPAADAAAMDAEQQRFAERHAALLSTHIHLHSNDRDPNRRLKIGYVSPDFYEQAESFFVLPLLRHHDHANFEIHCYSSVRRPDAMTREHRRCADYWHDVLGLSDAELAERIRVDAIDIMIDLTMHMRDNRLLTFARKPAPVQISWLAYPGSTGLTAIDYRLTDSYMDPPGDDTPVSASRPLRLPHSWCCYNPLCDPIETAPLPLRSRGHVTFGSLNNFSKINPAVVYMWSRVLAATPDSRLLLLCPDGHARSRILALFESQGIAGRIDFAARADRDDYLRQYNTIDIALDPFPYNGITTTCDALWMGVPVVTLAGDRPAARAGVSLLNTAGLPALIARDEDDFVRRATELAANPPRLSHFRSTLREQVRRSPLMDAPRFAGDIEAAYRTVWQAWCAL